MAATLLVKLSWPQLSQLESPVGLNFPSGQGVQCVEPTSLPRPHEAFEGDPTLVKLPDGHIPQLTVGSAPN